MSHVLAVLEQRDGSLRKISLEVVTGARRLADALGGEVHALVLGVGAIAGTDAGGRFGADKVITATNAGFAQYAPEGYARAAADRAKAGGYGAVVLAASAQGKDLAPRVAARLGVPLAADVTDLAVEGGAVVVTRPVYAGKALLKVKVTVTPAVVSLRPNIFTRVERVEGEHPGKRGDGGGLGQDRGREREPGEDRGEDASPGPAPSARGALQVPPTQR